MDYSIIYGLIASFIAGIVIYASTGNLLLTIGIAVIAGFCVELLTDSDKSAED